MKVKEEPNSAVVSNKFPIELENNDEEDDFKLKKHGHKHVRDSDDDNNEKAYKNVETNTIGAKFGDEIEVDVVS